jgi:LAO/AO transport system kinase
MSKKEDSKEQTKPSVRSGVQQPAKLNPNLGRRLLKKTQRSVDEYVAGILAGDRVVLSQAITLVESVRPSHQALASAVVEQCLPHSGRSVRIGITGTPGVGKSTFIERFGMQGIAGGKKIAVLAVDPTSQLTKGSILGDKTRMAELASAKEAFIRPSPAGGSLGGVARSTRETIILCEAAGFNYIIVETVGVGQSEIAVHSMVDFFLLLLLPGGGDELQGIKRGIVEMADLLAVNKADGSALSLAKRSRQAYRNALHLFPIKESHWQPRVVICSALSGLGIDEIWQQVTDYREKTETNGYFLEKRRKQARFWLHETISEDLRQLFFHHPSVKKELEVLEAAVVDGKVSPFKAADALIAQFRKSFEK